MDRRRYDFLACVVDRLEDVIRNANIPRKLINLISLGLNIKPCHAELKNLCKTRQGYPSIFCIFSRKEESRGKLILECDRKEDEQEVEV